MTAGLEAKLTLAVGARIMLRCNMDNKTKLVNSAIGTVLSITVNHVTVQFDHISEPYKVEKVKSRFKVMKNFYVYRKQFPLILAVCSLSGLYLAAFDPKFIMASHSSLKEVNRLREMYRNDLPQYPVPLQTRSGTKRKLTDSTQDDQPKAKKKKKES